MEIIIICSPPITKWNKLLHLKTTQNETVNVISYQDYILTPTLAFKRW